MDGGTESPLPEHDRRRAGEGTDESVDSTAEPSFREAFGAMAQKAGLARVKPGEIPTASSLLAAVGGVRGLIESILPSLGFLLLFTLTGNLLIAVLVPVGIAVVFVFARVFSRTPVIQAVVGLIGVGISAALALFTGRAEDNFVFGLVINGVYLVAFAVSILARYPLIGLAVGALAGDGLDWRRDKAKLRVLTIATALWAALFALRLAVQLPLYFAGEAEWRARAKLALGVPVYAVVLWVTWLLVRTVYARPNRPVVTDE